MQKLWIDLQGILHPVPDSHEEWANRHGHELEALLDAGWVRVQLVPPPYLLIDFKVRLNAAQVGVVGRLFENRFSVVVVEFGGVVREFTDGEEAMGYVLVRSQERSPNLDSEEMGSTM
jgi:hypothetical protein